MSKTEDDLFPFAREIESLAKSELAKAETALTKEETRVERAKRKDMEFTYKIKELADFREGYFEFTTEVSGPSVDMLLSQLRRFTRAYPKKPITIEMDSPGGSIIDGFRLYDELRRIAKDGGHHLTIRVRGMAASMAVPLLQAADSREVGPSAWVMIHRAAFGAIGKAYEVEDQVEFVKRIEGKIVDILCSRSDKPRKFFEDLLKKRKDIWYSAEEAVEIGLADKVA